MNTTQRDMFFLDINQDENPIIHSTASMDGNIYIRASYEKFVAYCKEYGFTYKNAVNRKHPLSITNAKTGNSRNFNLSTDGNICDIWICEEDPRIFLILSHVIDAK